MNMTRERLERFRELAEIVSRDTEELHKIRSALENPGAGIIAGPNGGGGQKGADRIGDAIAKLEKLEKDLRQEIAVFTAERAEIYRWCMEIRDLHLRKIVVWRVIDGYGWRKIARLARGNNTGDSVRMAYCRFIKREAK